MGVTEVSNIESTWVKIDAFNLHSAPLFDEQEMTNLDHLRCNILLYFLAVYCLYNYIMLLE